MSIYRGSDGRYFTDQDVCLRIESGDWRFGIWDESSGLELVETRNGEALMLEPIRQADLPEWVEIRRDGRGATAVDVRDDAE